MRRLSILGLSLLVLVMLGGLSVVFAEEAIVMGPEASIPRYKAWATTATFEGDDLLLVFGGDIEEQPPAEVYNFTTGEWTVMGEDSYPPAGENSAIVTVNNTIFAVGGENEAGENNKKAFIYDIEDGEWEGLPGEASMGHNDGAAAVVGDKIYLIGGEAEGFSNEGMDYAPAVDIYNTATNRWEVGAPCPRPRQDTYVVANGTDVYLMAGQGANETDAQTDDVMIYDTVNDEWRDGPNTPYGWEHVRGASVDGKIYIMTGKGEGGYYIYELDPEINEWREMASYNLVTRYGCGITAYKDSIYVVAGRNMTGDSLSSIEIYTPSLDSYVD